MNDQRNSENDSFLVLQEILRWTRVTAIALVGERIGQALASDNEKLVYHLSDGQIGSRDIAAKMGKSVSHQTVVNYWKKWARLGIVEPCPNYEGRWQRVIGLEELGIDLPKLPETVQPQAKTSETSAIQS
jgi:hypothetical protein